MNALGDCLDETWPLLLEPDGQGPWALRYLWFKHQQNENFLHGYFEGANLKFNLRATTAELAELWAPHNTALGEAAAVGDIIYRVKVLNKANQSIDHVEVWRSADVLHEYLHTDRNGRWPEAVRNELGVQLRARGFIIKRVTEPYPLVSQAVALEAYATFTKRAGAKDACNIFTPLFNNS